MLKHLVFGDCAVFFHTFLVEEDKHTHTHEYYVHKWEN